MPLLLVSGLPSREKTEFTLALCARLRAEKKILLVAQGLPAMDSRVCTSRIKSILTHRLGEDRILVVDAPLHVKSLRYEISAIARNKRSPLAHILFDPQGGQGGGEDGPVPDLPSAGLGEDEVICVREERRMSPEEAREARLCVARTFERPRPADKWDYPQLVCSSAADLDERRIGLIASSLRLATVRNAACTKLVPQLHDPHYLSEVKSMVNIVMDSRPLSTKERREIENAFFSSVRSKPLPLASVPQVLADFIGKYLEL